MEEAVAGGYKKIESGAADGYNRVADKFVGQYLTREGEAVEEARKRLSSEQKEREARHKEAGKVENE